MSTSTLTGTVDGISDYKSKDYFNIALDDAEQQDNWYIGDGSIRNFVGDGLDKGDQVRLEVNKNKGSITDIEVVGSGSDKSSGGSGGSDMDAQRTGERAATDSSSRIPKNRSILAQKALEEARKLHQSEYDDGRYTGDNAMGEYMEQLTSTADGFFNWMKTRAEVKDE